MKKFYDKYIVVISHLRFIWIGIWYVFFLPGPFKNVVTDVYESFDYLMIYK